MWKKNLASSGVWKKYPALTSTENIIWKKSLPPPPLRAIMKWSLPYCWSWNYILHYRLQYSYSKEFQGLVGHTCTVRWRWGFTHLIPQEDIAVVFLYTDVFTILACFRTFYLDPWYKHFIPLFSKLPKPSVKMPQAEQCFRGNRWLLWPDLLLMITLPSCLQLLTSWNHRPRILSTRTILSNTQFK